MSTIRLADRTKAVLQMAVNAAQQALAIEKRANLTGIGITAANGAAAQAPSTPRSRRWTRAATL